MGLCASTGTVLACTFHKVDFFDPAYKSYQLNNRSSIWVDAGEFDDFRVILRNGMNI